MPAIRRRAPGCWRRSAPSGRPAADLLQPTPYPVLQTQGGNFPSMQHYWTADFLNQLPDEGDRRLRPAGADADLAAIGNHHGSGWRCAIARGRGRDPPSACATAPWNVHYICGWADPGRQRQKYRNGVKAAAAILKPWATGRVYLNYIGDEGQARIESSFGTEKLARLRALKTKWDPQNFFRHNQNIRPA